MKQRRVIDDSAVHDLVGSVYQATLEPDGWDTFLHKVARMTGGRAAGVLLQEVRKERGRLVVRPLRRRAIEMDMALAQRYGASPEIIRSNPWHAALTPADRVGTVVFSHDVADDRILERTAFYQEILRPQNFYYAVNLVAGREGAMTTNLTLMRSRRDGTFEPTIGRLLATLGPHLERALTLEHQLGGMSLRADALEEALDAVATAVFVVDGAGRMLLLNRTAEGLLARRDGLTVQRGAFRPYHAPAARVFAERVACAAAGGEGGVLLAPRPSGAPAYMVQVSPLPRASRAGLRTAMVLVFDPETPVVEPKLLKTLFGLTGAEAEVAAEVANGRTVDEICAALEISPNTARTHLKRIFAKTGTSRQADLMRALLPLARPRHPFR